MSDTTPPPAVTGFIAADAYDGRVNLWWDKSTAEDFECYNLFLSESAVTDVTSIKPVNQIKAVSTTNYQITGLKAGTSYYFAVTAADKTGNENKQVACVNITGHYN
jgi:fibronectin type 3 domain-containing protein